VGELWAWSGEGLGTPHQYVGSLKYDTKICIFWCILAVIKSLALLSECIRIGRGVTKNFSSGFVLISRVAPEASGGSKFQPFPPVTSPLNISVDYFSDVM